MNKNEKVMVVVLNLIRISLENKTSYFLFIRCLGGGFSTIFFLSNEHGDPFKIAVLIFFFSQAFASFRDL